MKRTPRLAASPHIPNLGEGCVKGGRQRDLDCTPHLVIKRKQVVVKRQWDCTNQHILVQDLVPSADCSIAAERTLAIVLTTEGTARI